MVIQIHEHFGLSRYASQHSKQNAYTDLPLFVYRYKDQNFK